MGAVGSAQLLSLKNGDCGRTHSYTCRVRLTLDGRLILFRKSSDFDKIKTLQTILKWNEFEDFLKSKSVE